MTGPAEWAAGPGAADVEWWRPAAARTASPAAGQATSPASGPRLAFGALVVYTIVQVAAPQQFVTALEPLHLALVSGLAAVAAYVVDRCRGASATPAWPREVVLVAMLLAWAVITIPFSYWPGGSVGVILNLYLKSITVFVLLAGVVDRVDRIRTLAIVLVACAAVIAVTAVRHYLEGMLIAGATNRIEGYGTSALAGNPNDLALLLNIIIPLNVALCAVTRGALAKTVFVGVLLVSVVGVLSTFSRAGFITLALTGLLYLWRFIRRGSILVVAALLAGTLLLAVVVPASYVRRLSTISSIDADPTGSAQGRWRDTVVAAEFAIQHPLIGAGVGMDYLALNEARGATWLSVHNAYLNYAVDLGVIGLGLFLAIYVSVFRGVRRVERERLAIGPPDPLSAFATAVRIALTSFAVAACFHPIAYHVFFYYLAGLGIAVRHSAMREQPS
jgi:probable O-glycosylation ligase (exosortase A-associated)